MRTVKQQSYEVTIKTTVTYNIVGSGTSAFEAEQDAIERFHRYAKGGELKFYVTDQSKPKAVHTEKV